MVSGGKTTLCDYSMLFSLVIYQGKTAMSDFEQNPPRSSGVWADMATTISVMRLHANGCTWCVCIPIFLSSFLLLSPYNPLLLSIYLSISLPWNRQAISCPHAKMVRQLRQLKMTTCCFWKGSFTLQPSISKAIPLASRAELNLHLLSGSYWLNIGRPSS